MRSKARKRWVVLRYFWFMRGHFVEGRRWLIEALAASDAPTIGRAYALLAAAHFAQVQDRYAEGLRLIEQSVRQVWQMQNQRQVAECLYALAAVSLAAQQPQRAARLASCAQQMIEGMTRFLTPGYVAAIRESLGESQLQAEWEQGRSMTVEEVVAYACGE